MVNSKSICILASICRRSNWKNVVVDWELLVNNVQNVIRSNCDDMQTYSMSRAHLFSHSIFCFSSFRIWILSALNISQINSSLYFDYLVSNYDMYFQWLEQVQMNRARFSSAILSLLLPLSLSLCLSIFRLLYLLGGYEIPDIGLLSFDFN